MRYSVGEFWSLAVSAIFVQNLVLVYMLCSTSFFKALKKPAAGIKYGLAVVACTTLASALSWPLNRFLLRRFRLSFLAPFSYVLMLAILAVAAGFALKRLAPGRQKSFGRLIPVSAFSCAVLGLIFLNVQYSSKGFFGTVFYGFCAGIGFLLALFIMAGAMERVRLSSPPSAFRGLPIALVTASLVSLAFMGFSGIQIPY